MTRTTGILLTAFLTTALLLAATLTLAAPAPAGVPDPVPTRVEASVTSTEGPTTLRFVLDHSGMDHLFRWEAHGDDVVYYGLDRLAEGRHVLFETKAEGAHRLELSGLLVMGATSADPADCPGGVLEVVIETRISLLEHAISIGEHTCTPAEG